MSGVVPVSAHSSVEINNSCNGCCPRFCCWPRRMKHHHKHPERTVTAPSLALTIDDERIARADGVAKIALQEEK